MYSSSCNNMFLKRERTETDDIAIEKYIDVLQRSFTNTYK